MEDIEDMGKSLVNGVDGRSISYHDRGVSLKVKRSKKKIEQTQEVQESIETKEEDCTKHVPGTQSIFIKTYGCSHNVSDSEYMAGQLASYGYDIVEDPNLAHLWVVNSCTVKNPSEASFMTMVKKAQEQEKPIVVAGCVPQGDRHMEGLNGVSVVGVQQIDRVVEVVEETLKGNTVRLFGKNRLPSLDLPKIRKNPLVEIIPLSTGCLGSCTYCKTKHARGNLGSYLPEAIISRAQSAIQEGVREIWLSSEDTGAYGRDIDTDLPALLEQLTTILPQEPWTMLRVGMTNPPFILEHLDTIAQVLNHPNVFSFLHVPVQSGSDRVLDAMRREYTSAEFCRVADFLLAKVPGLLLATDIICGFPGETDEDFEETMQLVRKYKFPVLNISQFYPRPGTPAAKMKLLPTQVVKSRSRAMTQLFESYTNYDALIGTIQPVWVSTEVSGKSQIVGHTKNYVKVLLPRDDTLKGKCVMAQITDCSKWHIVGSIVSNQAIHPLLNDQVVTSSPLVKLPPLSASNPQPVIPNETKSGSHSTILSISLVIISLFVYYVLVTGHVSLSGFSNQ